MSNLLLFFAVATFWVLWGALLWRYRFQIYQMRVAYKVMGAIAMTWACMFTSVLRRLGPVDDPAQHLLDTVFATAAGTGLCLAAVAGIWWLGKTYTVRT